MSLESLTLPRSPFTGCVQSTGKTAALVIGLTSFGGMSLADATNYAKTMSESLTTLRQTDIPIVWGNIGPTPNRLIIPENQNNISVVDFDTLLTLHFDEDAGQWEHQDIHYKFLQHAGPRKNEVIYTKFTKDTLLDPQDVKEFGENYQRELLRQTGIVFADEATSNNHPHTRYIETHQADKTFQSLFKDPSLASYFKSQGIENLIVMGAIGHHCVSETALSGAVKGMNVSIATDRVLSWARPVVTLTDRLNTPITWQNPEHANDHEALITDRLEQIITNDPGQRQFTAKQQETIRGINLTGFNDWLHAQRPGFDPEMVLGR